MPDLIAQGQLPTHRWRRTLPVGRPVVLGRAAGVWATPWDDRISRRHVEICWQYGRLGVKKLEGARNPIFVEGNQAEEFLLKPGQHFVIGNTTFTLADERAAISDGPLPTAEQTYSAAYLRGHHFRDAGRQIEVLGRLPDLIAGAATDQELFIRVINVLLTGVPRASGAAVVALEPPTGDGGHVVVHHWDRRLLSGDEFRPSDRLIRQALERQESVVHVWSGGERASAFTQFEELDWAFCTPIPGEACRGWAIYMAGRFAQHDPHGTAISDPTDLRDDLKFTELAASTLGSLREVRTLERRHAGLSQFFSPVVLEALGGQDPDQVLAPRETEAVVLFCDLRGFSRRSEREASDLLGLLQRVSDSLGVMTRHILAQGGVVGDFHGDSAMGFWGWPLVQEDAVERACRAALAIRAEFTEAAAQSDHALTGFRIGIGIATGPAVAGKIGTTDQVKVTVFGPVVNLASRLEGMTKILRAPILLDARTAQLARERLKPSEARLRRLAVVRPYGMTTPVEVSELLPPAAAYPQLADEHLAAYEAAFDALLARDWKAAFAHLHRVPAEDVAKDFLTVYIAQHNRTAPENWDGVIPLEGK
jgi:adenylate cyclase